MKKILVLTDLSENSGNAYEYAVKMACQFPVEIILLFSTNGATLTIASQQQYFQELRSFASRYARGVFHLNQLVLPECLLSGDPWHQLLQSMVQVHQPDLILAGSCLVQSFDYGQEFWSLATSGACPFLFIPEKAHYQPFALNQPVFTQPDNLKIQA